MGSMAHLETSRLAKEREESVANGIRCQLARNSCLVSNSITSHILMYRYTNFLGLLHSMTNIYGSYSFDGNDDFTHTEFIFVMINNCEVLMYIVGACFPVLSPYLVAIARSKASTQGRSATLPSWRLATPAGAHQQALEEASRPKIPQRYLNDDLMPTLSRMKSTRSFGEVSINLPIQAHSRERVDEAYDYDIQHNRV
jgi:hypothetical protein